MLYWALTLHQKILGEFFGAMGRWFAVMGSSLVSLVSPKLGSLGLSLEKRSIAWKVSDRVGVDGVGAKFPFFSGFGSFPVAED